MRSNQICFVVNPKSHRVARHGSWLEGAVSSGVQLLPITDFATLDHEIKMMVDRGVHTFFIEGGDGTVLAVLSACARVVDAFGTEPEFAILPGGSTNLACKNFGFRTRSARGLRQRLNALLAGEPATHQHQRALAIECDAFSAPVIGFLLSTGTLARAMSYVQREFHGDGHRGSLAVAQAIFRFLTAPEKYLDHDGMPVLRGSELGVDATGVEYNGPHCLSLTTCLPRLSLGLNPFWGEGSGAIAMTYGQWPMRHFKGGLLRALFWKSSGPLRQRGFISHRATQLVLRPGEPIMVDGETYEAASGQKVTITLTEPIRFLR